MSGPQKLPDLPYFYGANAEQFAFYRIPKVFFTEPLLCGMFTPKSIALNGITVRWRARTKPRSLVKTVFTKR